MLGVTTWVRARGCSGMGGLGVSGEKRRCERDEQGWEGVAMSSQCVGCGASESGGRIHLFKV